MSHRSRISEVGIVAFSPLGCPNSWCKMSIDPRSCEAHEHSDSSCCKAHESVLVQPSGRLASLMSLLESLGTGRDSGLIGPSSGSWSQTRVTHCSMSILLNVMSSLSNPAQGSKPRLYSFSLGSGSFPPSRMPVLRKCSIGPGGSGTPPGASFMVFIRKTFNRFGWPSCSKWVRLKLASVVIVAVLFEIPTCRRASKVCCLVIIPA